MINNNLTTMISIDYIVNNVLSEEQRKELIETIKKAQEEYNKNLEAKLKEMKEKEDNNKPKIIT